MLSSSRLPSRSNYRSIRYSLNRQQNTRTADPSSVPKFRIKKNIALESTMMRTGGFEQLHLSKTLPLNNQQQQTQYLKGFYSMMDSQRKMSIRQRSNWNIKPLKFKIQNLKQLQQSQFTLLDPFHTHFKSIQTTSKKVSNQLQCQSKQLRLIKGQLQNINKRINNNINEIQKSSQFQLAKLSSLLKQNTIKQQQIKLKFKQQIAFLEIQHKQELKQFNQILEKNKLIQQTIFNCHPYELKLNQEWEDTENQQSVNFTIAGSTFC